MKNNFNTNPAKDFSMTCSEGVGSYVADMQLHMTLQAKNMLPSLGGNEDDKVEALLREAQAVAEKLASRQRS